MISRIFKVDTSIECNTTATDLAALFSNTQANRRHLVQVNEFIKGKDNPFTTTALSGLGTAAEEFQAVFFLAHTDEHTFGGFTPQEFADLFDKPFQSKTISLFNWGFKPFTYEDKNQVKDIYLFGCATGLANSGKNDSYAQSVANHLFVKGFQKVRVHAVAYEKQDPAETMYVEVIWQPARGDTTTQQGFISAHSLDKETVAGIEKVRREQAAIQKKPDMQRQELRELELKQNKLARQERHYYAVAKARRDPIAEAVPPLDFLKQAENTFIANETDEQRKQRIAEDPDYTVREQRKQIVALIKPLKDKKDLDIDKKYILMRFMNALQTDYNLSWQKICLAYKEEYKNQISIFIYTPPSSTLNLLTQLSEGIIPLPPPKRVDLETKGDRSDKRSSAVYSKGANQPHPSHFFPGIGVSKSDIPENLSRKIDELFLFLKNEISLLQQKSEKACISFFINFEKNTKMKKSACLERLKSAKTFNELQRMATTELENTRVTWQFFNTSTHKWNKSRTGDLLQEIVATPSPNWPKITISEPSRVSSRRSG